ncbi:MAG TPA: phytoene desaturase family protein [Actinomycetes bacterium]|jgi:phytoene desaturase|nr:phytoene desaturase family protein [Actinomycetes bacterium]
MAGRTVVVGAGLAGLSAAIHLAAAGREVVVVEAGPQPGGRCGTATVGGYRFDTGPTVLTMPEVLRATVGAAGEELDDWLPLRRLDPTYRLSFHDGSRLDVLPDAGRMAAEVERLAGPEEARRYLAFRDHLGRMHRAEWAQFVDRNLDRLGELARPLALWRVARLGGFRRLEALVATHLSDWRLRRAHTFQALYLGLSPFDALGLYAVVAYMDTVGGAFVPRRGGMHALPLALAAVAEKAGAELRYGARAERVEGGAAGVRAVRLASGERLPAGDVVVAADLPSAYAGLLPPATMDWRVRRRRLHFAPSCLLLHLGLPRRLPGQAHHTLHLGRDWKGGFEAITRRGGVQPDPSLLVTYPTPEDPDAAPPGHSTLYVLEPTANTRAGLDWAALRPRLRRRLLARLEALGYGDLAEDREAELLVDPPAWEAMGLPAGTPFSLDHRLGQTAWFRPANASATVPGLFFAGQGTVPGVGVPMVLISGRLAAERVLARRG